MEEVIAFKTLTISAFSQINGLKNLTILTVNGLYILLAIHE
jgi:hypothetical protein